MVNTHCRSLPSHRDRARPSCKQRAVSDRSGMLTHRRATDPRREFFPGRLATHRSLGPLARRRGSLPLPHAKCLDVSPLHHPLAKRRASATCQTSCSGRGADAGTSVGAREERSRGARVIQSATGLASLRSAFSSFRRTALVARACECWQAPRTLSRSNHSTSRITIRGIRAIAVEALTEAAHFGSLRSLALRHNHICAQGALLLANARDLTSLEALDVRSNYS